MACKNRTLYNLSRLLKEKKVLIPPLHIKLGLMKQFVKNLDETSEAFGYLRNFLPKLSEAKVKAEVFISPLIRQVFADEKFSTLLNRTQKASWNSFIAVVSGFLGNNNAGYCKNLERPVISAVRIQQVALLAKALQMDPPVWRKPQAMLQTECVSQARSNLPAGRMRPAGRWMSTYGLDYSDGVSYWTELIFAQNIRQIKSLALCLGEDDSGRSDVIIANSNGRRHPLPVPSYR
ncbi:hypothetical protein EVAR_12805_1 [Eumeta japonica]|uniref:Uncharacterized protein n=1 Tax=Eumeta variegata TaxID=151549 RepID=A0A4C1UC60_EUMVA|nr:hypothetical protein EVAR_12805_1 [Eumeta japonica]